MQYYKSLGENIEGDIINLYETYDTKLKEYFGKIQNKLLKDLFQLVEQGNTKEIDKIKSSKKSSLNNISENISSIEKRNEFEMLLNKHEKEISNIDSKYILCFVRLNSYLKSKKSSLKKINELINTISSLNKYESTFEQIDMQIKALQQMEVFSLLMITALLDQNMILFYTIYEKFDQMGVFESNWEKELLKSLDNINENIIAVVNSINRLEINMRISLMELGTSITSQIADASSSIDQRLASIGSDLKFNNLLTAINTFQLFSK